MKKCAWCGRENTGEATHCPACGTELVDTLMDTKPPPPRDWSWMKAACAYIGATLVAFLLYLLSFGPVTRFSATISQTTITTNGTSFTFRRTVAYPRWVGVVYYPAFSLTESGPEGILAGLYWRYLQWWEPPPTNN
jgi:hypothetical protein